MLAFIDPDSNLTLLVDTETPEELSDYSDIQECLAVCIPNLIPETNSQTNAPIFGYKNLLFWLPDYLTNNPMEILRDTGTLTLKAVIL